MACQDCTGAVELFGEDEAGEFVGECDGTKRELEGGVGKGFRGPAVGGADGKDDVLGPLIAAGAEPGGELGRAEGSAAAVEQDEQERGARFAGLRGAGEPGEESCFGGEGFGLRGVVGLEAVEIEAGEGVVVGFEAGLGRLGADVGEGELHGDLV